jgi:hypothetical protein
VGYVQVGKTEPSTSAKSDHGNLEELTLYSTYGGKENGLRATPGSLHVTYIAFGTKRTKRLVMTPVDTVVLDRLINCGI